MFAVGRPWCAPNAAQRDAREPRCRAGSTGYEPKKTPCDVAGRILYYIRESQLSSRASCGTTPRSKGPPSTAPVRTQSTLNPVRSP